MSIDFKNHENEKIRAAYLKAQTLEHKKYLKNKERQEMIIELEEKENLCMTKICADLWKLYRAKENIDYSLLTQLESIIWQNLINEWGEDSFIDFNYENNVVICKNKNKEIKI